MDIFKALNAVIASATRFGGKTARGLMEHKFMTAS